MIIEFENAAAMDRAMRDAMRELFEAHRGRMRKYNERLRRWPPRSPNYVPE
jgi:hypothetical protein